MANDDADQLSEAIENPKAVSDRRDATQKEIDKAKDDLDFAVKSFDESKKPGTKSGNIPSKRPFIDVQDEDYFEEAVDWAVENDITKGTTDTTF